MVKGMMFYVLALMVAWFGSPAQAGWGDFIGQQILSGAAHAVGEAVGEAVTGDDEAKEGAADGQSVNAAAGRSYAASSQQGDLSLEEIAAMPAEIAPMPVKLEIDRPETLRGRPRIAIPSYGISFISTGEVKGYAAGQGSSTAQRSVRIKVALAGLDEADYRQLADEAYADLLTRLRQAGIDAVTHAQMSAVPEYAEVARVEGNRNTDSGVVSGRAEQDWVVFGASDAPLVKGMAMETGFARVAGSQAVLKLVNVGVDLDAVIVQPLLVVDFAYLESSGSSMFTGRANASAQLGFSVQPMSRVDFNYATRKGLGNIWGSMSPDKSLYSDEPFAVLHKVGDNAADQSIYQGAMLAGLGNMFKTKQEYAALVVKARYMGLVRAAYAGFNGAIVDQIRQSREPAVQTAKSEQPERAPVSDSDIY